MSNKLPFKETIFSTSMPSMADIAKKDGDVILQWDVTPNDMDTIRRIGARIRDMGKAYSIDVDTAVIEMDVACVHLNCCALELWQLLASSGDDFSHDVLGIVTFLNRKTGQLKDGWKPRFAKKAN